MMKNRIVLIGFLAVLVITAATLPVAASLEVPEWAGGEYDGTVLFVAEGI